MPRVHVEVALASLLPGLHRLSLGAVVHTERPSVDGCSRRPRPPAAPAAQAAPPTRSKHATGQEERSNARGHRHGPRVVRRGHAARGGCVGRSGGPVGEVNTDQVRGEGGRVDTDRRTNGSGSGVMTERREMCGRSGKGEIQR